jgi:hypothetical protein
MSRRLCFALRVVAISGVSFAVLAPASFGQAAASLSGESFESTLTIAGQETSFGNFNCNKGGNTTISFTSNGSALGPYTGTFSESGSFTIGPQTDTTIDTRGVGAITNFQATFTVDSQFPAGTVTGSKQLSPTAPTMPSLAGGFGSCDPNGSSPPNDVFAIVTNPNVLYDAQISTLTGSRSDSGTASVVVDSMPSLPSLITFQEVFNSTEPVPSDCDGEDEDQDDDCQGEDGDGPAP